MICIERPKGEIIIQSFSKDGIPVLRKKYKMHSMTQNYWRILNHALRGDNGNNPIVRMDGSFASLDAVTGSTNRFRMDAGSSELWGIRVGTGIKTVSITDVSLNSIINHGSQTGELFHLQSIAEATEKQVNLSRTFENLSGAEITIKEVAITASRSLDASSESNPYMFARDLLDQPFPVGDAEYVTVTATMAVEYGTRNATRYFETFSGSSATATFYHRDGSTGSLLPHQLNSTADQGTDNSGLLLGTGEDPISFEDIDLASRISNGSDPGDLVYGAMEIDNYTITNNVMTWQLRRNVNNLGGQNIEAKEMGLFSAIGGKSSLLYRFLLPNPVTIEAGDVRQMSLTFKYILL